VQLEAASTATSFDPQLQFRLQAFVAGPNPIATSKLQRFCTVPVAPGYKLQQQTGEIREEQEF
jgi:hypothetical protein